MTSHTHSFAPEIIGQQSPSVPSGCRLPAPLPRLGTSRLYGTQLFHLPIACSSVPALSGRVTGASSEGHCHCSADTQKHVQEWKWTEAITMHNHAES